MLERPQIMSVMSVLSGLIFLRSKHCSNSEKEQ